MVANPTRELEQHLKELHLPTMRQCYGEQATVATHDSWTYEQYLHEVVALEVDARQQNRVARYLRESRLPPEKSWDAFNRKRLPRKIDVQLNTLRDGAFIDRHENVLAFGNPGSGKTHLLCALGQESHPSWASGALRDLQPLGPGALGGQARVAVSPARETAQQVPAAHH